MKVIGINGSNRKNWNTHILLEKALDGASSQGAETEIINLYDINYKGCYSCFNCKKKNGKSYGKCSAHDDLEPVLRKIESVDAIVLASPIYFRNVSGEMRSFLERLIFSNVTYTLPPESLFPKKIKVGFIYTMNNSEKEMKDNDIDKYLSVFENMVQLVLGPVETLYSFDTLQFRDYSNFVASRFNAEKKADRRKEVFPIDCNKAYEMGIRLIQN